MVINTLSSRHNIIIDTKKRSSIFGQGSIGDALIDLVLPTTYMNESGKSVLEFVPRKSQNINQLLVVYDDKDLPLGKIRLRPNGSAGGHNGVRSIINSLGTEEFPRLRVGIGDPQTREHDEVIDYVLGSFSNEEKQVLDGVLANAADCIEAYINLGIEEAMNQFN
tara:strand:+ start:922 stop:1416 length:495 start_codon:yes stop_codon:yes gene_type:complete